MILVAWLPGSWKPDAWKTGTWESIASSEIPRRYGGGTLPSVWELFVKRKRFENMAPARKKAKATFKRISKLQPEETIKYVQEVYTKLIDKDVVEVKEILRPYIRNESVNWPAVTRDANIVRTLVSMDVFVDLYPEEEEVLLLLLTY